MKLSLARVLRLFSPTSTPLEESRLVQLLNQGVLTKPEGAPRSWTFDEHQVPILGERLGLFRRPKSPVVIAIFVTKGGALKTTLTLHLARTLALHNLRTLVVGLDLQGDISRALTPETSEDSAETIDEAIRQQRKQKGLYNYALGEVGLVDLISKADLPTLDFISETPELIALDVHLMSRARREEWLLSKVVTPLKARYDVILLDCSPNWNQLTTNALVAADILLSPLECRINNFRNLELFQHLIEQCRSDLGLKLDHWFLPTRVQSGRKLNEEILAWYRENLPQCMQSSIREAVAGEEAVAVGASVLEYAPESPLAEDWRQFNRELSNILNHWHVRSDHTPSHRAAKKTEGAEPWR